MPHVSSVLHHPSRVKWRPHYGANCSSTPKYSNPLSVLAVPHVTGCTPATRQHHIFRYRVTVKLTALFIVVVLVADAVADASHIATVLDHVDGDVVVFEARRFRVDTNERDTVVVPRVGTSYAGAGAAIATIITCPFAGWVQIVKSMRHYVRRNDIATTMDNPCSLRRDKIRQ